MRRTSAFAGSRLRSLQQGQRVYSGSVQSSPLPLFEKLLVANRGEIACRVFRSTKKLGIRSVAVFSEADRNSMHAQMADESFCIGPPVSSESYLSIARVIKVAKETGAQAVHPGYGFLSENFKFSEELAKAGITFIGPPVQALKDMGSKSASKDIMTAAGVPVVPGYHGENQDRDFLRKEAARIKYPIMIKAVLGGGGKGMRIVRSAGEFDEMLDSSRREALKSFNDDRVLLEKYIERPRHIEMQIFGDTQGDAVYLFERDCSVQRRHQKILEEAPAPGLTEEQRKKLGAMAVAAAKAVKYVGAGTVEFIFDCDTNEFYFMEMNTRLQVEHPVTEMITDLDLVHWQLHVASGNPLPLKQDQVNRSGHAIEARIYAENTENNFMPDTGRLKFLRIPESTADVRIETGVREGDEITVYYDPMIAKVIVRGENRLASLQLLDRALRDFNVVGVRTNIPLLRRILAEHSFKEGMVDTSFIRANESKLLVPTRPALGEVALGAVLKILHAAQSTGEGPWERADGFSIFTPDSTIVKLKSGDQLYDCRVFMQGQDEFKVILGDEKFMISASLRDGFLNAILEGERLTNVAYFFDASNEQCHIFLPRHAVLFELAAESAKEHSGLSSNNILQSPMPCRVCQVPVKVGAVVKKGDILMVVEAMKMEHVLKAPRRVRITKVAFGEGQLVGEKRTLIEFEDVSE